jgi:Putative  PD-(D/E)XK family member, (DUF4420)
LQPLLESLGRVSRRAGHLAGQEVVLPREDAGAIIALDSDGDVHLLLSPVADDDDRFARLNMRGLRVAGREWSVGGRRAQRYLDVSCAVGETPSFRRPFLRFAEDVLFELATPDTDPTEAVYRTGLRWRRFWSADTTTQVTAEWLHGIFGELQFLAHLVDRVGPNACRSWAGPQGHDHDFQAGTDVALEVKTSVEMPFRIHCNLRQLDPGIFHRLYLVCYRMTPSDAGASLPELVAGVEEALQSREDLLDVFHLGLAAVGYRREMEPVYNEHRFDCSAPEVFPVDVGFPKLTEGSFSTPPDHRVSNIRYSLEVTGVEKVSLESIGDDLARLALT